MNELQNEVKNLQAQQKSRHFNDQQLRKLRKDVKKIILREEKKDQEVRRTRMEQAYGAHLHS